MSRSTENSLLGDIHRDRRDHAVGQLQAPSDEVFVPPGRRVEGAGVDRDSCHGE
jgi:hypothetical protein